jgi:hypothetical protein
MIALLIFLLRLLVLPTRPERQLKAENAALRQQLAILQRKQRGRVQLTNGDRLFFVHLYRWFPSILATMTIIQPQTLLRWHREGFRRYWRWKSRKSRPIRLPAGRSTQRSTRVYRARSRVYSIGLA